MAFSTSAEKGHCQWLCWVVCHLLETMWVGTRWTSLRVVISQRLVSSSHRGCESRVRRCWYHTDLSLQVRVCLLTACTNCTAVLFCRPVFSCPFPFFVFFFFVLAEFLKFYNLPPFEKNRIVSCSDDFSFSSFFSLIICFLFVSLLFCLLFLFFSKTYWQTDR